MPCQFAFALETLNQANISPFGQDEISVLLESALGHLCYLFTDVPPQPNSPPDRVFHKDREFKKNVTPKTMDLPVRAPWTE